MSKAVLLVLLGLVFREAPAFPAGKGPRDQKGAECVILLHGIGRSSRSFGRMASGLAAAGYRVVNLDYPSTKFPIEYLSEEVLLPEVMRLSEKSPAKLHFVTHSLGGILVRYFLQHHDVPKLGRVVMLSPPNEGSPLADVLKRNVFFRPFMAPAGRQLGTDEDSLPRRLGPARFELGIIAGSKSENPINSLILDGPDDGTVTVESTKLAGMADFIVLRYGHRSILRSRAVIDQVICFLRSGSFRHDPSR